MASMMIMGETFDRIIKAILDAEKQGVTRYQISQRCGVDQGTLSKMISGEKRDVTTSTADKILEALDLELAIKKKKPRAVTRG